MSKEQFCGRECAAEMRASIYSAMAVTSSDQPGLPFFCFPLVQLRPARFSITGAGISRRMVFYFFLYVHFKVQATGAKSVSQTDSVRFFANVLCACDCSLRRRQLQGYKENVLVAMWLRISVMLPCPIAGCALSCGFACKLMLRGNCDCGDCVVNFCCRVKRHENAAYACGSDRSQSLFAIIS